MQVLYERCAAVDVGKDVIAVAVRLPGDGPGRPGDASSGRSRRSTGCCAEAARWLTSLGVTHVAMEATGIYSMPVYHALIEHGDFDQGAGVQRRACQERAGPQDGSGGRGVAGAPAGVRAAGRQLHPARGDQGRPGRDPVPHQDRRSRGPRRSQRLGNVLQDAGIKIDSVASSIATKSGRAMIEALIDGERRGRGAGGPGQGQDAGQDPGPVDGAGRPVRGPSRPDVPPAPGPHRPPRGDDRASWTRRSRR